MSVYTCEKWSVINDEISSMISAHEKLKDGDMSKILKLTQAEFNKYISQLPVIGYNNNKYDLNLVKKVSSICMHFHTFIQMFGRQ